VYINLTSVTPDDASISARWKPAYDWTTESGLHVTGPGSIAVDFGRDLRVSLSPAETEQLVEQLIGALANAEG
jgi:hypothetical protein